jgi:heat shock protein HslJ
MPRSSWARILPLVAILACDGGDEDPPPAFGGRTFVSESVEGHTLVPGTQVVMRFFEDGRFSASAGCNSMMSEAYGLAGGVLSTGPLSITEKGCSTGLHEQDEWLAGFLEGSPAWTLDDPRLTLTSDGFTVVLLDEEVADPDRSLQGRVWTVNGLIDGMSVGWGDPPQLPTLEFFEDGTLAILTPCAPGTGAYVVDGTSITFSDVSIADEACPDDEVSGRAHDHMVQVLADGAVEHEIDADRLTISRGDLGLVLVTP